MTGEFLKSRKTVNLITVVSYPTTRTSHIRHRHQGHDSYQYSQSNGGS